MRTSIWTALSSYAVSPALASTFTSFGRAASGSRNVQAINLAASPLSISSMRSMALASPARSSIHWIFFSCHSRASCIPDSIKLR